MRRAVRRALGIACVAVLAAGTSWAMQDPPRGISYTIEARFDPGTRTLTGREEIAWINRSAEPVAALPLHLYLNAFAHTRTSWMREGEIGRFRRGLLALRTRDDDPWGWIEPGAIRQVTSGGERDLVWRPVQPDDGNPLDRTLAEITLAEAIPPGGTSRLRIEFESRLPIPIARAGGRRDFFVIAQWYPKIGVVHGGHARQYHALTEFFADFADYDVRLTVPRGWLVGGTGRAAGDPVPAGDGEMAHRYVQRGVHDAAFVTGGALRESHRHVAPAGGGPEVDVRWIVPVGGEQQVPRLHEALQGAMDEMGRRVGPYPYDTLTVATVPFWAEETAGMEYPTFFLGWQGDRFWDMWPLSAWREPEITVLHEFIHQYFYGIVASNEVTEALLDEGFTQYWQLEVGRRLWGEEASAGKVLWRASREEDRDAEQVARDGPFLREPMRRVPSWLDRDDTWGTQVYDRPALTLETAARLHGREALDRVFAAYVDRFAFAHPGLDDFLTVARHEGGDALADFLGEAFTRERLPDFRVAELSSERWEPPVGYLTAPGAERIRLTGEEEDDHAPPPGLDPEAREPDGQVLVEISDPGWYRNGTGRPGEIRRERRAPSRKAEHPEGTDERFYESVARLEGPAWDHLPAEVEFLFDDGTVLLDTWDGKAAWRDYRFVRPSRLVRVRIDPAGSVRLDVRPQNNGRALQADERFAWRWAAWIMGLAQWAASGASLWL